MCAVLKKGNWISLLLRVWNMEPQPEMVVENNATTILQERVLIDNLFDLYWMLLEVYIQKKFFAAWSGNTRRRSSEYTLLRRVSALDGPRECSAPF